MRRSWNNCSPRSGARTAARRGTTLIEVVAGLVILGTLLASVAIARGRFLRQWGEADRRLQATRAVDGLMSTWIASPSVAPGARRTPVPAHGELSGLPGHVWRTRLVPGPSAAPLNARVVRLEVFDRAAQPPARPVLTVDFLEHAPARPAAAPAARLDEKAPAGRGDAPAPLREAR